MTSAELTILISMTLALLAGSVLLIWCIVWLFRSLSAQRAGRTRGVSATEDAGMAAAAEEEEARKRRMKEARREAREASAGNTMAVLSWMCTVVGGGGYRTDILIMAAMLLASGGLLYAWINENRRGAWLSVSAWLLIGAWYYVLPLLAGSVDFLSGFLPEGY